MTKNGSKNPVLGSKTGVSKYVEYLEYFEHVFSVFCIPYFPYRDTIEFIFCLPTRILIKNLITSLEVRTLLNKYRVIIGF